MMTMMIMMIPMQVTLFEKVNAQGDDVHNEQHPDPPCVEHTTLMIIMMMLSYYMTIIEIPFGASHAVVVGRAVVPMVLVTEESQPVIHVKGQPSKAWLPMVRREVIITKVIVK